MKWDFNIYDGLNECVYVTDADTYEIKYLNRKMMDTLDIDSMDQVCCRPCYEVLQGLDHPCENCSTPFLKEGEFYEWNYYNPKVQKYYSLKDTLITEGANRYRLEIALDLSLEEKLYSSIRSYAYNEAVLNDGMKLALAEEDPDESINAIITYFAKKFESERAYVFEKNPDGTWTNTYEWCREGVSSEINNLKDVPDKTFDVWREAFSKGENVIITDLEETKDTDPLMYDYLAPQKINSLVVSPIVKKGEVIGFFGVDNPPAERLKNVSMVFKITGYFLNYLLKRRDDVKKMRYLGYYDQLTGLKNRHAMNAETGELEKKKNISLIFCDVMGLKVTNDTYGHLIGDELLIRASNCLKQVFEDCGLYRVGGDEFLVILTGYSQEEAETKIQELEEVMNREKALMAVGTIFVPELDVPFEKLLTEADEKMYAQKHIIQSREFSSENQGEHINVLEKSFYPEALFYLKGKVSNSIKSVHKTIESLLGDNSAVGIVGGYYDSDFSMCFVSGFALNILGYNAEDFSSSTDNLFGNVVWPEDKPKLYNWMNASKQGSHIMRLIDAQGQPVWVNEMRLTLEEEGIKPIWIASIRPMDDEIGDAFLGNNYLLAGIIDVEDNTMYIQKTPPEEWGVELNSTHDTYDKMVEVEIANFVIEDDAPQFRQYVALNTIVQKLSENSMYEFSMRQPILDKSNAFVRHRFRYFDKDKRFIICSIEDVTYLAVHDSVVDCLNNDGFINYMERFLIYNPNYADYSLLFFNICDFKALNEILGFEGGNAILREVASLINNSFLEPILLARAEADHFFCLVKKDKVNLQKLKSLCHNTVKVMEKTLDFRVQCGIYEIVDKKTDIRSMCARALLAQKSIENNLFKPYAFFDISMSDSYRRKAELVLDLSKAIKEGYVKIFYQPIFDCKTKEIVSAEALVRWLHPEDGMIPPDVFIPELEKKGKISELDLFVADEVSKLYVDRANKGKKIVPVSINLSRIDLIDKQTVEKIVKIIERDCQDSNMYRYELTESAFIHISKLYAGALDMLRDKGAKILIDDFGSGYSSFASVLECEFDIIKLDMGFVRKIGQSKKANAVIKSMITMAHQLNAKVIAEGVEEEEQRAFLDKNGCDFIQGYLLSKPVSKMEFLKMLD